MSVDPPDPTPTRAELATRLGCGALAGLLAGAVIVVSGAVFFDSLWAMAATVFLTVILCTVLAWRLGDRFFHHWHKWLG